MILISGPIGVQHGKIKTYPNPVIDNITIETISAQSKENLVIYYVTGKEIINEPMTGCKISVNVSQLDDGVNLTY